MDVFALTPPSLSTLAFLADLSIDVALDLAHDFFLGVVVLRPSLMEGSGVSVYGAGSTAGLGAAGEGGHPLHPNLGHPILPHLHGGTEVVVEDAEAVCCVPLGAEAGAAAGPKEGPASLLLRAPGGAEAALPVLTGNLSRLAPDAAAKPWECGKPSTARLARSLADDWILVGSVSI